MSLGGSSASGQWSDIIMGLKVVTSGGTCVCGRVLVIEKEGEREREREKEREGE